MKNAPEPDYVPLTALVKPETKERLLNVLARMPWKVSMASALDRILVEALPRLEAEYPAQEDK